jgi:hypothetical protein
MAGLYACEAARKRGEPSRSFFGSDCAMLRDKRHQLRDDDLKEFHPIDFEQSVMHFPVMLSAQRYCKIVRALSTYATV